MFLVLRKIDVIETKKKERQKRDSNMELLRIVSMLLVLVVHVGLALGTPSVIDVADYPLSSFLRFFCQSLSVICVNVFILISGWYGVHPKISRFSELIFQVFFIGCFLYIVLYLIEKTHAWCLTEWLQLFTFRRDMWFVNSYIVLYVFTPLLNSFAQNANKKQFVNFMIAFFLSQCAFGFISTETFFSGGYSPLSFMGLYLLARYARLYPNKYFNMEKHWDIVIYLSISLFTSILSFLQTKLLGKDAWAFYLYSSPLVIMASFYFFLFFTKLSFHSKAINWIAGSAFAIYIVHCDPLFFKPYYLEPIKSWYIEGSCNLFLFKTLLLIICVFFVSIVIDKIRSTIWAFLLMKMKWRK